MILIIIGISVIIVMGCYTLNKRITDREKLTIYECGNQEYSDIRNKFNIQYYLIALSYLVFDVETILLYPLLYLLEPSLESYSFNNTIYLSFIVGILVILGIIAYGLYYELKKIFI